MPRQTRPQVTAEQLQASARAAVAAWHKLIGKAVEVCGDYIVKATPADRKKLLAFAKSLGNKALYDALVASAGRP